MEVTNLSDWCSFQGHLLQQALPDLPKASLIGCGLSKRNLLHFITDFMSVLLFDLTLPCPLGWKTPIVWEGSVVCHCFSTGAYTVTGTKGGEVGGVQGNHCGWKGGRLASQRGARVVKICEKFPGKEHRKNPGPVLIQRDLDLLPVHL